MLDRPEDRKPLTEEMEERIATVGELFMLADNLNDSNDSRYLGMVPEENLIGKVEKPL